MRHFLSPVDVLQNRFSSRFVGNAPHVALFAAGDNIFLLHVQGHVHGSFRNRPQEQASLFTGNIVCIARNDHGVHIPFPEPLRRQHARPGGKVPTVSEAQGHIIVTINSNSGIFSDYTTLANTYSSGTDKKVKELSRVFDKKNVHAISKTPRTYPYRSEDKPEAERSPRLIHTSCYQAPFRTPARTSADIYKWILGETDKLDGVAHPTFYKGYYYGIVLFDYVKEKECRLIIDLNDTGEMNAADSDTDNSSVPATATVLGDSENAIAIAVIAVVFAAIIVSLVVIIKKKSKKGKNNAES